MIVAATGHRSEKIGYHKYTQDKLLNLTTLVLSKVKPDKVISGVALGFDTAFALAAIELNIPFIAAVPFSGQELKWRKSDQVRYHDILSKAEKVIIVSAGGFESYKMQVRNEWMVDNCNIVLALWNGSKGGTANCIDYANRKGKKVVNLWSTWERYK